MIKEKIYLEIKKRIIYLDYPPKYEECSKKPEKEGIRNFPRDTLLKLQGGENYII